jgi:Lipocalin-like domain
MKKMMSISRVPLLAAALILSAASRAQEPKVGDDARDRFIGAWRQVRLEEPGPDGNVHRPDCTGMFVFTRDGRASVQVMYRNPQAGGAAGSVQYAQGGHEATFGRYQVDPSARTFTYRVEGALVRSLIGKDLVRSFELSGNQLIVKSSNPNERWRVVWEHY